MWTVTSIFHIPYSGYPSDGMFRLFSLYPRVVYGRVRIMSPVVLVEAPRAVECLVEVLHSLSLTCGSWAIAPTAGADVRSGCCCCCWSYIMIPHHLNLGLFHHNTHKGGCMRRQKRRQTKLSHGYPEARELDDLSYGNERPSSDTS